MVKPISREISYELIADARSSRSSRTKADLEQDARDYQRAIDDSKILAGNITVGVHTLSQEQCSGCGKPWEQVEPDDPHAMRTEPYCAWCGETIDQVKVKDGRTD